MGPTVRRVEEVEVREFGSGGVSVGDVFRLEGEGGLLVNVVFVIPGRGKTVVVRPLNEPWVKGRKVRLGDMRFVGHLTWEGVLRVPKGDRPEEYPVGWKGT